MGRGLSELQRFMLFKAADRVIAYKKDRTGEWDGFTTYEEVYQEYYGWQLKADGKFSKAGLGRGYMSGIVALRKSVRRLEDRGLIYCPQNSVGTCIGWDSVLLKRGRQSVRIFDARLSQ